MLNPGRLTAGGCYLLRSKRLIAGTRPVKIVQILSATKDSLAPGRVCVRAFADGTPTCIGWGFQLSQHGRETILINLKVAIPLTTDIRLGQNRLTKRRVLSNRRIGAELPCRTRGCNARRNSQAHGKAQSSLRPGCGCRGGARCHKCGLTRRTY